MYVSITDIDFYLFFVALFMFISLTYLITRNPEGRFSPDATDDRPTITRRIE